MFENDEIRFVENSQCVVLGRVLACEEGVGITIVDAHDKDRYVMCIDCRIAVNHTQDEYHKAATELTMYIIDTIKYKKDACIKTIVEMSGNLKVAMPTSKGCVFNQ